MTNSSRFGSLFKGALMSAAVLVLMAIAVPLLALLALISRPLALVVLLIGLPMLLSQRVRDWLGFGDGIPKSYRGVDVPSGVALHQDHVWTRASHDTTTVGVDDLIPRTVGPVHEVVLPKLNQAVAQGEVLFTLRRGDRRLDVRAPFSGRVAKRNRSLIKRPTLINSSAYEEGWVVEMTHTPSSPTAAKRQVYRRGRVRPWFRDEVDRLIAMADGAAPGSVAVLADGGMIVDDLHQLIDDAMWEMIRADFFE